VYARLVFLCGLDVPDRRILRLARLVEDKELEMKLRKALARDDRVLTLSRSERETILLSLDEPPAGLEELRATLISQYTWRRTEGL
jgi:hypothetical protein